MNASPGSAASDRLDRRDRLNRSVFDLKTRLLMRGARTSAQRLAGAESMSALELAERARRRTMALARHAFDHTDFYRRLYTDAGLVRADLEQVENLEALPLLRKEHVRAHDEQMRARGLPADRFLRSVTGGSTGSPLVVYNDRDAPNAAMWWRVYRWWGIHPGDDAAFVYRQKHEGVDALKEYLTWWPTRHLLLDARDMNEEAVDAFLAAYRRVRPRLLVGYVEGVVALARRLAELGVEAYAPHAISVTSSVLHPGQRELMEQALGAPVYDTYRSAEVPWIAAECSHRDGLHIQADIRHVEIVDDDGRGQPAGQTGDVAITDLTNEVFPLVRYVIGDRSRTLARRCECGITLPRIAAIEGRIADGLRTPSGHEVIGGFSALFNQWPTAVQQFQIHQYADYRVELRYVPGADLALAEQAAGEVRATLEGLLHREVPVVLRRQERIEHVGGKARLVRSDVSAPDTDRS